MIAKIGVCNAVRWAGAREKDLLIVAHFVGGRNNFATRGTDTGVCLRISVKWVLLPLPQETVEDKIKAILIFLY